MRGSFRGKAAGTKSAITDFNDTNYLASTVKVAIGSADKKWYFAFEHIVDPR